MNQPPYDLATELLTGEEDLAINGPKLNDYNDMAFDEWRDNQD